MPDLVPPSAALFEVIQDRAERAPAWSVWYLGDRSGWLVPRYGESCSPDEEQVARVTAGVCSPRVREVVRTGSAFGYAQTREHDEAKLRYLAIAARRDLLASPESDFAYPSWHCSDESAVTRAARMGRDLWRALGAWPWSVLPGVALGELGEWWLRPEVRSAFDEWSNVRGALISLRSTNQHGQLVF